MLKPADIGWMAGWLEGEGSFGVCSGWRGIRVTAQCSDRDVVERCAAFLRTKVHELGVPRRGVKRQYGIRLGGNLAAGLMMTIYRFLGIRRREAVRRALFAWKNARQYVRWTGPPSCHSSRVHHANGLCRSCYRKKRASVHRDYNRTWMRLKRQVARSEGADHAPAL